MGLGGISIWQLVIILLIVVFIFGTKRLRGMGSDLGGALKGFKKALNDEDTKSDHQRESSTQADGVAKSDNANKPTPALEADSKESTVTNAMKTEEKQASTPSSSEKS